MPSRASKKGTVLDIETPDGPVFPTPSEDEDGTSRKHKNSSGSSKKWTNILIFLLIFGSLLGILVWDLRRTHVMSNIIHNDHQSLWVKMNDSALVNWFSPYDLCMLKNSDTFDEEMGTYYTEYRNCSKFLPTSPTMKNKVLLSSRLFCNIGASMGKSCPAPLEKRKYFYYQLRDPRYQSTEKNNQNFMSALRQLAKEKIVLLFIGDGLTKQNFDALICEIFRIYYQLYSKGSGNDIQILSSSRMANHNDFYTNNINEFTFQFKSSEIVKGKAQASYSQLTVKYLKMQELYPQQENKENPFLERLNDYFDLEYISKISSDYLQSFRERRRLNNSNQFKEAHRRKLIMNGDTKGFNNQRRHRRKGRKLADTQAKGGDMQKVGASKASQPAPSAPADPAKQKVAGAPPPPPAAVPTTSTTKSPTRLAEIQYQNRSLSFPEVKDIINGLLLPSNGTNVTPQLFKGAFIIANIGVFYNSREKFRYDLKEFLEWLNHLGQQKTMKNKIFFRETTAQHWNHTESGYYDQAYRSEQFNNGSCVQLADSTPGNLR
jgi:hypothetical protein